MKISLGVAKKLILENEWDLGQLMKLVDMTSPAVETDQPGLPKIVYDVSAYDDSAAEMALALQLSGKVTTIGQSHVGRLLNSPEFLYAVQAALKLELLGDRHAEPTAKQMEGLVAVSDQWLHGSGK
ncbi:hypothetical protein [Roseateles amylovorans]|uniref:Uncharacterized protein n=1 Tax=Roseateles amylovorans TaxID=2978473 RepID=A0ABY6B0A7_9BURK|nr:hypothetical protein [Roseateles amylovorans]UXH78836.1 hypothetical protein N4261_02530 [Roseateles amylovorans]